MRSIFYLICTVCFVVNTSFALNVGEQAPDFELSEANGKSVKLSDYAGKIVVLEWMNPGCPYVKKHYSSGNMQKLQREMVEQDIVWLVINSTNNEHGDFVEKKDRVEFVKEQGMAATAYLTDEDGKVGLAYEAKTTPHMFVINTAGAIAYQGAIDDVPMGDPAKSKNYVQLAISELLAGGEVTVPDTKSYGCSVKY